MEWYLSAALVLVGCGAVLLLAEFLLPTGGLLVVAGVAAVVVGVGLVLLYGSAQEAVAAVVAVCLGLPVAGGALFSAWKRLALKPGAASEAAAATVADQPEVAGLDRLKGRFGRAVTPMRPAGAVEIDGRRVDALTEGMPLDAGAPVKCVDVKAGRVIVRGVDGPRELSDMDLGDFG